MENEFWKPQEVIEFCSFIDDFWLIAHSWSL